MAAGVPCPVVQFAVMQFGDGNACAETAPPVPITGVESDWAAMNLVFAEYKTRGPVILKSADTAELIEKLEDSQMTLGSMSTNRWEHGAWADI